ncbi:MAG: hypothetical protein WBQ08_18140 [Candidatus Sulfotelmatobacter sp.]
MNVFEANAAELEKLRERVDDMFRERSKSPEHTAAWQEAARAFSTEYDKLAFPGGLSREFELLRAGDATAIEMAIRFLDANPRFFRSGYYKVDILKLLRKHPLSDEQCDRMRKVILERVRDRPVREMRAYARFAPKVSTPQFEAEMANISENANCHAARHAQWVIDCLKSARGTARQGY